ncbi:MAG: PAS domain S-box protein [Campylobacterales bacterium]
MKTAIRKNVFIWAFLNVFFAILFWMVGFFYLSSERDNHKKIYLEKQTISQKIAWDSVLKTHKIGMTAYFESYIDKPEVASLLAVANGGSEAQKAKARNDLYNLLSPVYAKLQDRNVRQLHFQDKDNNSFLRFHQIHNFGDSLNATRPSIVMANKNLKPVFGFETGKVVSGFRNVFPIVWDSKHIGSVELSQPFDALKNALQELDGGKEYLMIIRAEAIMPKLFEENKKSYAETAISKKWLFEKDGQANGLSQNIQNISNVIKSDNKFLNNLETPVPFASEVTMGEHKYVVTVTPVIDLTGKHTAAVLSFSHAFELETIRDDFRMQLVYFSLMLFVASMALFWLLYSRKVLFAERNRLSAISETMGEGMYVIDKEGRIEYINEAALSMLGLTLGECSGQIAHYLFHSHEKNEAISLEECPIFKTIHTSQKYEGIDHFRRKNGDIFTADVISSPLKDDDDVVGSVTVFRDITERIKLEEKLTSLNEKLENQVETEVAKRLESEAIFKTIFEKSPEGILIKEEDNVYKECNAAAAKMLGYTQEEIIGKKSADISPDIQPETGLFSANAVKLFSKNAIEGATQHYEWTHTAKDGSQKLLEVMLSPIIRGDKKELLVIWRDITQIKELQKEKEIAQALLIQQSKMAEMGAMIGAIAHQWKQPLNAIWLMTQDLKMSYDYGEVTPELISKFKTEMGEQVKFMSQTIEDFRNFYKPSTTKSKFGLAEATRSVLSLLRGQLGKEDVELISEFDDTVYVHGFESEFKQVILNIVNNAKEALRGIHSHNKYINVKVYAKENLAFVEISDNAGGIDEKLLEEGRLFEPFNTTKGESGTGVGMSLSKTIIEKKMGGRLSAKNIEDGALFTIELHPYGADQ